MFITFEGIEGCGKTTQVTRLQKRLTEYKIPLVTTFEPGGTAIGKGIRRILLDAGNKSISPLAELMLYAADRAQHVEEVIKPALDQGLWVLCDRFFDATVVYQGFARKQDMDLINILNGAVTQGFRPDLTFLFDCPVKMGIDRALKRNQALGHTGQDRFEKEKLRFHEDVRSGYLELAGKYDKRFVVVDASQTKEAVEEEIIRHLGPFLAR